MFKIIDKASLIDPLAGTGKPVGGAAKGCIQFKNVSFRYPTRPEPVLTGFNLRIEAG